jgi:hypothetical protein
MTTACNKPARHRIFRSMVCVPSVIVRDHLSQRIDAQHWNIHVRLEEFHFDE